VALLGARAADRFDAEAARGYFKKAIAAAHPRERMHLKRMADASLALAERRADDLKQAVEKLGGEAPSGRQLFALKMMGLIVPPSGASLLVRLRGFATGLGLAIALIAIGTGIVELISLPAGGIGLGGAILLGIIVVVAALGVLALFGRRRQRRAKEARGIPTD
jgi:hypothetical protein